MKNADKVKAVYERFENFLLSQGYTLARDTGIGFWGVTNLNSVQELFEQLNLKQHKQFLDLGSGDGRVVLLAALHGLHATGIEYDQWLHESAQDIKKKTKIPAFKRTQFLQQDFMNIDFSQFDLIYVSPDKPLFRGLEQKLARELQGKLIVHGWEFLPKNLKCEKEFHINGDKFGIYTNLNMSQ